MIGNHLSDKKSSLYKTFETVKEGLNNPTQIDSEVSEYLSVLSSVNGYQRINYKEKGELAKPNDIEASIIKSRNYIDIPENLKEISLALENDVLQPEKMIEKTR